MAASNESEHVVHYFVWLCVAIFIYVSRHPRLSLSYFIILYFAPSEALFSISNHFVFRAILGILYYSVVLCL